MSISIERSVVEQFKFNGQNVRSVHVKYVGECLVASDVYKAVGYGKEDGKKAVQSLVLEKHKLRYGDAKFTSNKGEEIFPLHPDTVLLKEAGLYCFLLRCKKEKAEPFMDWVVEAVLPREVRKLGKQLVDQQQTSDLALQERDMQLALLNDDLTEAQEHSRQLEFNNTGLQGEIRAKDQMITQLTERYVDHAEDPGLDNVVMVVRKHTTEAEDKRYDYPYYIARIQRRAIGAKRRWFSNKFARCEEIVIIDNPNSVHAFNRFEEQGHVRRYKCHFMLIDLTREDLYNMGVPAVED